ncbi:MAG: GIY-YIG nuclease family protein [Candidatus Peribacteraceae bacterium]|jgi:putative endonuclease|nr:GIY-YIG nuclease family protein [Candidatus Peribacteraceae bacterium]MDD5739519.1 GIY-YIG nuclease family protein [Candidatus Peribacteraceae bacterium]
MPHYFYLARCCDGSLYAGSCIDLKKREQLHNEGKGAKYTRAHRPVRFVYHEQFATLGDARRREAQVKTWTKTEKEKLIQFCQKSK